MATVNLQLTSICSGGNHLTFNLTGAASRTIVIERDSMLDTIDEQDVESFIKVLTKLVKQGRTMAQARTLLQTGVTVAV